MRTTLILNDELVTAAKRVAAGKRTTLSAVVNEALRTTFMSGAAPRQVSRFRMPVFRGDGGRTDTPPCDLARLMGHDDGAP